MEQNRVAEQDGTRTLACELLRKFTGREDAVCHDGQYEAIEALVAAREGRGEGFAENRRSTS